MSPPSSSFSGLQAQTARAIGAELQRRRVSAGRKQEDFAQEMGISRTTLSLIERGRQRIFVDHIYRAAQILRIPPSDLVVDIDPRSAISVTSPADQPLSRNAKREVDKIVKQLVRTNSSQSK